MQSRFLPPARKTESCFVRRPAYVPEMILITGATGFVGTQVVRECVARGFPVRLLARKPEKAQALAGETGAEVVAGDILNRASLREACQGMKAVIHLVGIIFEHQKSTFERIHVEGTANVVGAAAEAGVSRFLQMSAIGSRSTAPSRYHRTKFEAEQIVRQSGLDWTVFRPSIIYGPQDQFVRLFSRLMDPPLCLLNFNCLPLPFKGKSIMQPVPVECVARAFATALTRSCSVGKTYELCGPGLRFEEMIQAIARAKGLTPAVLDTPLPAIPFYLPFFAIRGQRPVLIALPGELARIMAWIVEHFSPVAIMNSDQMLMLQEDQQGNPQPAREDLDIDVPAFCEQVKACLN